MARYLVSGGAGFIGRHLCGELIAAGHQVRILDAFIEQVHGQTSAMEAAALPPEAEVVEGDLRDGAAVRRSLQGVDGVFHLAAEVGVGQSMYEIERYVGVNDLGTATLLQALIEKPVGRIVVASSMSVYGEGRYLSPDGVPVAAARRSPTQIASGRWNVTDSRGRALLPAPTDEDKVVDLASIYALTKYMQERAVLIFGEAFRIDAVALRLFNVFGPGQALSNPYTGVLANFASRLANGERPLIFEDGEQRRDFVHVRDVARAFRLAMEKPGAAGQAINVGSGRSYSIRQVAELVAAAMQREIAPEILQRARAGDIRNCFADIARAKRLLDFQPAFRLEDSLGELADWVASQRVTDRAPEMRQRLEALGLVS